MQVRGNTLQDLLTSMWQDYRNLSPAAGRIFDSLEQEGEQVLNDHIALRTFNHPRLGIKSLSQSFEKFGYKNSGEYFFKEKKLYAQHFEHADKALPKIFISELELEKVSTFVRKTLTRLTDGLSDKEIGAPGFSMCGRPWKAEHQTYLKLADESEYASWVYAFGFRPNHFTVNVNALRKFSDLPALNRWIESKGYRMNQSGGIIKGNPAQFLEQSSTMAEEVPVQFSDGQFNIPSCYYEFAKRYALPNGELYQGFVATSADKIFESTNRA